MKVSDDILEVLLSTKERKADNIFNRMMNLFSSVEESLYMKNGKLIYEVNPQLQNMLKIAMDSKSNKDIENVIANLIDFNKKI